ncbi:core protein [Salmonella enterica subsp. salamae]|nr:core protein [Salmonella enterica subsp. salamae]
MEPEYTPERTIYLYHRGLPLALISQDGDKYDEWGNVLREDNPSQLEQLIRLPGQQYDEESRLHYNRHRYYDPGQGRYITQDPTGLAGGWNLYQYPLNPVQRIDLLGLSATAAVITALGTDLAIPEPTDAFLPKWLGWGIAIIGAVAIDGLIYLACSNSKESNKDCYEECKHLLPSPSGDLQSSEYRKCYRECMGSL